MKGKKRTGRSTRAVVSHDILLKWHIRLCSDSAEREDGLRRTSVALFGIWLDSDTRIHQWTMIVFVLLDEGGVYRVSDITWEEEGASEGSLECLRFGFVLKFESDRNSFDARADEVGLSTVRRNATNFFIIPRTRHWDPAIRWRRGLGRGD